MAKKAALSLLTPRTRAERAHAPSLTELSLDPGQRAAIARPADHALLVLGEAGHGKTTVLVHRVAAIVRAAPSRFRAAVVVPTEGLVRHLGGLFVQLGTDVEVMTFDAFAEAQARRALRRLPRVGSATPPAVMRMKRAPELRDALSRLAERAPGLVDDDRDESTRPKRVGNARVSRGDLQHLFGDRALLEDVARRARLPGFVVEAVLDWTRVQFEGTAERQFAHVIDRDRLVTVDGRKIDDGTPTEHAGKLDVEDLSVLLELDRLRAGLAGDAPSRLRPFDLLAIDEAQELAPLELALLGRSVAEEGTLIVAGDADQQTDETATFVGWEAAMRELGQTSWSTTELEIGYRCPPRVVEIARAIRFRRPMVPVPVHRFDSMRALAARLGSELGRLLESDSRASVAMVCRKPDTARGLGALLSEHVPVRIVFDGRFHTRGPVQISLPGDVKGLEFDYVIVADANEAHWPDDAPSRRALYVAVTRARHECMFACVGEVSTLLR